MSNQDNPLSALYVSDREKKVFGDHWCGPATYEHGEPTVVAKYYQKHDDDGEDVEVLCSALPARFFRLRSKSFRLMTGSGKAGLVHDIAKAVSEGMLCVEVDDA